MDKGNAGEVLSCSTGNDNQAAPVGAAETAARAFRLPLKTLIGYGSSMIGLNGMATMISVHLLFFYTDIVLIASTTVGAVMALAQVWDAVTDPLMGHVSDHTSWKWGRRRPYIMIGMFPAAILFFLLFSPPLNLSIQAASLYFAIVFIVFYTFRTVWETPYFALAPEITLDYDERTRLSAYQQVFATLGDILGTMAPVILVGIFATQRGDFSFLGLLVAVLAIASGLFTYFGTRENPDLSKTSKLPLLKSLKATAGNRPFLLLVLTSSCTAISNYTTIAVTRYIVKYYFQREDLYPHFFAAFFVGVFISIPLWIKLTGRIGKKNAYIFTMLVYAALLWVILLLGPGDYFIYGATMIIAGAFNIGLWLIPGSILPDIIEWDQLHVGDRREGAFYGIWTLIRKGAIGGAFMIIGYLLDFVGYVPNVDQTPQALLGIKMLFGPIPSVLLVLGILIFLKFPITKEVHRNIVRQIDERRKEAQK
ncbi:MAG: MFS transporter [Candidatus Abyssobacteria bacterium SURF_5]|uniref:MFS transporter n=1 Tax=Abyssobacteria bacterium (strain SURF_5) TaxID=2093360 RepID=A0A3A4NFZ0_ABYX5|nr:MAG: MFS transporter [Candidatus Abyssubacteria bacterium SURF_5]